MQNITITRTDNILGEIPSWIVLRHSKPIARVWQHDGDWQCCWTRGEAISCSSWVSLCTHLRIPSTTSQPQV